MTNPPGTQSRQHPDEQELAQAMHASDALRQLLAAAAAPPSTAELKGRSRAVAAFRAAYRLRRPGAGGQSIGSPEPADQVEPAADADPQPSADSPAGSEDRAPTGGRRRTRLARARRWSAAQLTVVGTALLMLLEATAAAAAAG